LATTRDHFEPTKQKPIRNFFFPHQCSFLCGKIDIFNLVSFQREGNFYSKADREEMKEVLACKYLIENIVVDRLVLYFGIAEIFRWLEKSLAGKVNIFNFYAIFQFFACIMFFSSLKRLQYEFKTWMSFSHSIKNASRASHASHHYYKV